MGITESNIIKARSGRYKDTEENRRLHRVGQQYGEKKVSITEVDSKNLSKYSTKTLQNASKAMTDKIRAMRNTLSDVQGDEGAMEAVQAKIDSATRGLVAVNLELAKRGVKATGNAAKEVDASQEEADLGVLLDEASSAKNSVKEFEEYLAYLKHTDAPKEEISKVEADLAEKKKKATLAAEAYEKAKQQKETEKEVEKQGRVHLEGVPNSSKVNLAKYLSAKAKANIDRILGQVIPTKSRAELTTMYDDAVRNFNGGFDDMKKAARANMLYQILTIKAALDNKQSDKADIPLASNMSKEEFADYIASERGAARKVEVEAKMEQIKAENRRKLDVLVEEATKAYKSSGVDNIYVGDGIMNMYWKDGGELSVQGPSKWHPEQDYTVRVSGLGDVYFNSEYAQVFILAGKLLTEAKMKKQALDFLKKYQDILANLSKMQK